MKIQYELKVKYPRLPLKFESGDIVYYNALSKAYVREKFPHYAVDVNEVENNPDFWELIEEKSKPLFITEDGVEVFKPRGIWSVNKKTLEREFPYVVKPLKEYLYFAYKSNADEYIWRNKRVFSYEDMMKAKHSIILTYEDIEKAAKERSKQ